MQVLVILAILGGIFRLCVLFIVFMYFISVFRSFFSRLWWVIGFIFFLLVLVYVLIVFCGFLVVDAYPAGVLDYFYYFDVHGC